MKHAYTMGMLWCTASSLPISLVIAVMISIEKGWDQFLPAFILWVIFAVVLNLIIGASAGAVWGCLTSQIPIGNYLTTSFVGAATGLALADWAIVGVGIKAAFLGSTWGGIAACSFWYGWNSDGHNAF